MNGFIYAPAEGGVYLTAGFAESLPPLPMEPQLTVEGLDLSLVEGLTSAQGVSWTDHSVQILGTVHNGVLTVSANASG